MFSASGTDLTFSHSKYGLEHCGGSGSFQIPRGVSDQHICLISILHSHLGFSIARIYKFVTPLDWAPLKGPLVRGPHLQNLAGSLLQSDISGGYAPAIHAKC